MPMIAGAAIMAAAAITSAGISYMGSKKASKLAADAAAKQQAMIAEAVAELEKVGIPSIEAQKLYLENPELVYQFVPKLQEMEQLPDSAFEDVKVDPRLLEAQMDALNSLQERGEGGLTLSDLADIADQRRQAIGEAEAQRNTTLQRMEQRGMGGSGAELASQLSSQQDIAQRRSEESDRMAAMNYEAKMAAINEAGKLSGSMRNQDITEQSNKAKAMDAIEKFNLSQRSDVRQRNIEAENQAAREMASLRQNQETNRAALANTQQEHNKALIHQDYVDRMNKAKAIADAKTGWGQKIADAGATAAKNTASKYGAIASGIAGVGKAAASAYTPAKSSGSAGSATTNNYYSNNDYDDYSHDP